MNKNLNHQYGDFKPSKEYHYNERPKVDKNQIKIDRSIDVAKKEDEKSIIHRLLYDLKSKDKKILIHRLSEDLRQIIENKSGIEPKDSHVKDIYPILPFSHSGWFYLLFT